MQTLNKSRLIFYHQDSRRQRMSLLNLIFAAFTGEEDEWETLSSCSSIMSSPASSHEEYLLSTDDSASLGDALTAGETRYHLPSDESFFQALIDQTPDEKSFLHCSGTGDEGCFAVPVEQSSCDARERIMASDQKLEIDELLFGDDYCQQGPLLSLEVFLRVLHMKASEKDFHEDDHKELEASSDELLLLADFSTDLFLSPPFLPICA